MTISIILADDHPILRLGVASMLRAQLDCEILAECEDGATTIEMIGRLKPDILILDLMMPGLAGFDVIRKSLQLSPASRIIVLSMHSKEGYVLEAMRSGAVAFVIKDSGPEELIQAIKNVQLGRRYLSPEYNERAIECYLRSPQEVDMDLYRTLTPREREVLKLIADGLSNNEIAARLEISARTAEIHRLNMMHKLNITSLADLVKYAIRRGITQIE
jgi:two-component system, NarL family, response regulator NreC